jgi:hypothetical protein
MPFETVPPPAHALVEALRGLGYNLWTAIADIIDNSIAAGAGTIRLDFGWEGGASWIRVSDDGHGMDESELAQAMRPGSRNPLSARQPSDLGRFGLGLKTASFSQCRRLTVASRRAGMPSACRLWDLDEIARHNEWRLGTEPMPSSAPLIQPLESMPQGTIVLWEKLDRVVGTDTDPMDRRAEDAFLRLAERTERHLGMIFHRYLDAPGSPLRILLNGDTQQNRVRPWDPFLEWHPATTRSPEERLRDGETEVRVQGFVLPHRDRLDERSSELGGGPEGWVSQQGFYVYRNRRLLVPGDWLGLGHPRRWAKEDAYRLARLRLDIPNSADAAWQIDVRKSSASPPRALRGRLTDLAERVRADARRVFLHRGSYGPRAPTPDLQRAWSAIERRDGVAYRIDRAHPAVARVLAEAGDAREGIEAMLRVIEETVPVHRIWIETAEREGLAPIGFGSAPPAEVRTIAEALFRDFTGRVGLSAESARSLLSRTEPFNGFPDLVAKLGTHGEEHP